MSVPKRCKHDRMFCLDCHLSGDSTDRLYAVRESLKFEKRQIEPVPIQTRLDAALAREAPLQARLTAAEQRNDDLESILRRAGSIIHKGAMLELVPVGELKALDADIARIMPNTTTGGDL